MYFENLKNGSNYSNVNTDFYLLFKQINKQSFQVFLWISLSFLIWSYILIKPRPDDLESKPEYCIRLECHEEKIILVRTGS